LAAFRSFSGLTGLVSSDHVEYAIVVVLADLLICVGAMVQSIFISKALHSKSTETSYCHHTVHVASIARFLSFLNLGMWIMKTVDVEGLDHKIYLNGTYEEINYFQYKRYHSNWLLLLLFCIPITIFYRIHSAITLYRVSCSHNRVEDTLSMEDIRRKLEQFNQRRQQLKEKQDRLEQDQRRFIAEQSDVIRDNQENHAAIDRMWQDMEAMVEDNERDEIEG
jgi:hypothetical protein